LHSATVTFTCHVPHNTYCMARVQKTLTLPVEVAERLEEEDNQSEATAEALREYYDL